MVIENTLKEALEIELKVAKSVWIASAMISKSGWNFIQKNIPRPTIQHYLIGIDLATEPSVFENIISNLEVNAKIYENAFTFHPKVYIVQKEDNSLTAFVGSSNTTSWGLEKNIEMNFRINDQRECKRLLNWFNKLYKNGYLITNEFVADYKEKFVKASYRRKEIEKDSSEISINLTKDKKQFFKKNQHEIFKKKYHRENSQNLKDIRKSVKDSFLLLHKEIYPQFQKYGLTDLHCHHQSREIVSRHFFNPFSGNYINAMWLHYGKSFAQLQRYSTKEEKSFINNIRIQVIIHEDSIGIWLVLGKDWGSVKDRAFFRQQMTDPKIQKKFFDAFKLLGNDYWINIPKAPPINDIKSPIELASLTNKENIKEYFIIGRDINWLDTSLSNQLIAKTILEEFKKLYPLYEIMRHK